ncbi:HAD family hydrolase [Myxococcus sp. K15C18031901]|uniref:HAD family hydrolase n=1 Tax=Myxococcus dinghuensis TaxID=2906761 RepID=UPI0020A768C4|nr:HAD family hydrolase [Myxococcus dinghuensis]MCP3102349.1 HAD family hydrolase [Myxococcus dinghuensis]
MGRKRSRHYEDKRWMNTPRAFGLYGPARPRALFFDIDDTLVDRAGAFHRYLEALMARYPQVFPVERRTEDLARIHALDGRGHRDRQVFCEDVVAAFPGLGLPPKELWWDIYQGLPTFVRGDPELVTLLGEVAKRQPVQLVSNGSGAMQRKKLLHAGLYHWLPDGTYSGDVGAEKPDARIFRAALDVVQRDPSEVLHIGDDPERDIVGAANMGFATCWVSHGRTWPESLPPPTFTLERITSRVRDLAAVLAQWT